MKIEFQFVWCRETLSGWQMTMSGIFCTKIECNAWELTRNGWLGPSNIICGHNNAALQTIYLIGFPFFLNFLNFSWKQLSLNHYIHLQLHDMENNSRVERKYSTNTSIIFSQLNFYKCCHRNEDLLAWQLHIRRREEFPVVINFLPSWM